MAKLVRHVQGVGWGQHREATHFCGAEGQSWALDHSPAPASVHPGTRVLTSLVGGGGYPLLYLWGEACAQGTCLWPPQSRLLTPPPQQGRQQGWSRPWGLGWVCLAILPLLYLSPWHCDIGLASRCRAAQL